MKQRPATWLGRDGVRRHISASCVKIPVCFHHLINQ
jgi:hypothetical protein